MNEQDTLKCFVSAYYGIRSLDEYDLKEYVLKDIENYIKEFIQAKSISNYNYKEEAEKIEKDFSLIQELQNSLIVFREIEVPIDLVLLIKRKINELKSEELKKDSFM